jgi:hypothetical protein
MVDHDIECIAKLHSDKAEFVHEIGKGQFIYDLNNQSHKKENNSILNISLMILDVIDVDRSQYRLNNVESHHKEQED